MLFCSHHIDGERRREPPVDYTLDDAYRRSRVERNEPRREDPYRDDPRREDPYRRGSRRSDRDDPADLVIYATKYNNEGDEYFYGNRRAEARSPERRTREADAFEEYNSNYNPEIYMRDGRRNDYRDERDRGRGHMSPERERQDGRRLQNSVRNFGQSIENERRALGDMDYGPSAYKLNEYRYRDDEDDYGDDPYRRNDPFRQQQPFNNIERELGYLP